jgi:hypothetical protein
MIELEFRNVDFYGGRKTGEPGEKPLKQGRESTTNSAHMKYQSRGSNPQPTGTTEVRGERIKTTPPMLPMTSLNMTLKNCVRCIIRILEESVNDVAFHHQIQIFLFKLNYLFLWLLVLT